MTGIQSLLEAKRHQIEALQRKKAELSKYLGWYVLFYVYECSIIFEFLFQVPRRISLWRVCRTIWLNLNETGLNSYKYATVQ